MIKALLCILPMLVHGANDATTSESSPGNSLFFENNLTLSWTEPRLNKEGCDSLTDEINITLNYTGLLNNARFYTWYTDASSLCSQPEDSSDYEAISGAGYATTITRTYSDLYDQSETDVCETDTAGQEFKLCVGIDTSGETSSYPSYTSTPNGQLETLEPQGYALFVVDTLAPPAPDTPGLTPLDSALRVKASVSAANGAETDDVTSWTVHYREKESGQEPSSCLYWTDFSEKTGDATGTAATLDVPGKNGVDYELCVFCTDAAGNQSEPSEVVSGAPIDECDFMECYPGELKTGHCSATGGQVWSLLLLWGGAFIRRRKRNPALQGDPHA